MVHWASISLTLALSIIHGWHMVQMDFVLAYPQADIKVLLYMEMTHSFECKDYKPCKVVLALCKNLYNQKQAGCVWYQHLTQLLTTKHCFTQSIADKCVFYQEGIMLLIYVG